MFSFGIKTYIFIFYVCRTTYTGPTGRLSQSGRWTNSPGKTTDSWPWGSTHPWTSKSTTRKFKLQVRYFLRYSCCWVLKWNKDMNLFIWEIYMENLECLDVIFYFKLTVLNTLHIKSKFMVNFCRLFSKNQWSEDHGQ